MKKFVIPVAVVVALFFGVGGIPPALTKVRDVGAIPSPFVESYTLGVFLLTLVGASTVFHAAGKRNATLMVRWVDPGMAPRLQCTGSM